MICGLGLPVRGTGAVQRFLEALALAALATRKIWPVRAARGVSASVLWSGGRASMVARLQAVRPE
eukprot:2204344-Alexandrium_andersonii.AAC.1